MTPIQLIPLIDQGRQERPRSSIVPRPPFRRLPARPPPGPAGELPSGKPLRGAVLQGDRHALRQPCDMAIKTSQKISRVAVWLFVSIDNQSGFRLRDSPIPDPAEHRPRDASDLRFSVAAGPHEGGIKMEDQCARRATVRALPTHPRAALRAPRARDRERLTSVSSHAATEQTRIAAGRDPRSLPARVSNS